jgi:ABC-type uncharacterized transport system substrate-binding protein
VGFLRSTTAAPFGHLVEAFRDGLKETGFVENANVTIEYRYANNRRDRLPALARELVRDGVSVIAGNSLAAEAAKAITSTVPIVFVTSDDPVKRGLVHSLARPGGNATGFTFFGGGLLGGKRLGLLAELVPDATAIGFLMDPNWPAAAGDLADTRAAARTLGKRLVVAKAASVREFEPAIAGMLRAGVGALIVGGAPAFSTNRRTLIELSRRHRLPAMYDLSEYVNDGGLISYSASLTDAYRHAGVYAGKILSGAKPEDLPVQQPTRIELALNLKTAKALGLTVPPTLLALADKIVE